MERIIKFLKYFFSRVFILYLAAFLLVYLCFDYKKSKWQAHAATLSRLQPPYNYLTQFSDGEIPFNRKQFEGYRLFFTQLLKVMPERPDGNALLGYSHYQLGDTAKALTAFQEAQKDVPSFLWFNYDLGLIYFQKKDYQHAADYLNRAIVSSPEAAFTFMLSSKVYLDLIATVPNFQQDYLQRFQTGVRDSFKMLVLSYFHLQQYDRLIVVAQLAVNQKLDDDGFFHYYLGVGAVYAQEFDRAIMHLQESLKKNPDAAESYYYLAMTLKSFNKEEMAVVALQKAQMIEKVKGTSYSNLKNIRLRIF